MKLLDFNTFEPFNRLKEKMGIPPDQFGALPSTARSRGVTPLSETAAQKPQRAWILLPSGRRLDLLNPDPNAWTDEDLAIGLSRTYRWGGYSKWSLPLSVAQHSLAVLALSEAAGPLTARAALRELLHDATEALFGGFDPIAPLKPHLGREFRQLDQRLQAAVDQRYGLARWTIRDYASHKHADQLAAANEAFHVVGWSRDEMRDSLDITLEPLDDDPLPQPLYLAPWQPWPPTLAKTLFLERLQKLRRADKVEQDLARLALAFFRLPEKTRRHCRHWPAGNRFVDTFVEVEADDGSAWIDGVVVDGERDEAGAFTLDDDFIVFTTIDKPNGELIRCNGANCHVERL